MKGVTTALASRKEDIVKYVPADVKGVSGAYSARETKGMGALAKRSHTERFSVWLLVYRGWLARLHVPQITLCL